jgi:ubiquinone/menaquinone biosynthesis C-methylase UbiE
MHSHINFGYPNLVIYGHLLVTAVALPLALLAWFRRWSKWVFLPAAAIAFWSLTAFAVVRFGIDMNGRMTLPAQSFLASGTGRVLDMGAGTGRSSIMALEARPNCTLVALDLFGDSYDRHFGTDRKTQDVTRIGRERLLANLRAAGVDQRASIQPGDMRQMPFEPESFDAIVSAYAIDHLDTRGVQQSLAEAARVLKPKGEFLLMVLTKDAWLNYVWGPVLLHAAMRGPGRWLEQLDAAGFDVAERGTRPGTLYFLARKR